MTRLPYGSRRALTGLALAVATLATLPAIASAQSTATPEPVIDRAPAERSYGDKVVIKGHLENGTPGDEITLQQRRAGGEWRDVRTKNVDEEMKIRFKRRDVRKTTDYRLAWSDELQEVRTYSKKVTTKITPMLTLHVNPDDIFVGRKVKLKGKIFPKVPGRRVILQQKVAGEWRRIARARAGDGDYFASFKAHNKGYRKVRAIFRGDGKNSSTRKRKPLTIYREDRATWYGPGFYGNSTACGKTLTRGTLGVAHRTLPCGTKVSILYRGRTITVQVIDRGPYSHANWDLTQETAERIGFSGTDDIGVTK